MGRAYGGVGGTHGNSVSLDTEAGKPSRSLRSSKRPVQTRWKELSGEQMVKGFGQARKLGSDLLDWRFLTDAPPEFHELLLDVL